MNYRTDIDGLRAIAVTSVILFHLGILPHGYLGVDVFFVISGFLITSIVYRESEMGTFSIRKFYERRIRRILPLSLLVSTVALMIGLFFMLPDDLENLAQSVVASNFSANNILMYITSSDYWAVKNDYKALMHTWSLGIEEQFYILYPLIFWGLTGSKQPYIKTVILVLTIISITLFLIQTNAGAKFYFIQYRFFELSIGGLCAIYFKNGISDTNSSRALLYGSLFLLIVSMALPIGENDYKILFVTAITATILVLGITHAQSANLYQTLLSNRLVVFLGKISFSLYMWHQLVFAFARYVFFEEITPTWAAILLLIILALSVLSYYFVENTFRNRNTFKTKTVLLIVGVLFAMSSIASFYVYYIGGIIRDYPSLDISKNNAKRNLLNRHGSIQIEYNELIREIDRGFESTEKLKVLVIGNSYGRDVANIVLESHFKDSLHLRYFDINRALKDSSIITRMEESDVILLAAREYIGKDFLDSIETRYNSSVSRSKLWVVGTKDFGYSNGIHYNRLPSGIDYNTYRTMMKKGVLDTNEKLKSEWGTRYIDLIELIIDNDKEVLVFTPNGRFISQDTAHLTKDGAIFFSEKLKNRLAQIFGL